MGDAKEPSRMPSNPLGKLKIKNTHARECLAEFLGTFVLLSFGDGSVAQAVLSKGDLGSALSIHWSWGIGSFGDGSVAQAVLSKGDLGSALSIHWSWGIGVIMGIYVAGGVSGAHLNPAVTLAQACLGRFPWRKTPLYMLAQYAGAFVASLCVYLVYYDALKHFDNGTRYVDGEKGTAGIWATYPKPYVTTWNCLGDQIFGTSLLLLCILAVTDPRNAQPSRGVAAISIGLIVVVIGMTFGLNCGYAINPARDLGPRIFTSIAGWGAEPFKYRDYNYFWVPIFGPYAGGVIGAFLYQFCVGFHWPDEDTDTPTSHVTSPAKKNNTDNAEKLVQYDGPYITESL